MPITLDTHNLNSAERILIADALKTAGSIVEAAHLLGITRHSLKRRIIRHNIRWPPPALAMVEVPAPVQTERNDAG